MNDLIEAAIETGECLCHAVGRRRVRCCRHRNRAPFRVSVRHAFELARQGIETLVDGGEVFADVIVVIRFPV